MILFIPFHRVLLHKEWYNESTKHEINILSATTIKDKLKVINISTYIEIPHRVGMTRKINVHHQNWSSDALLQKCPSFISTLI